MTTDDLHTNGTDTAAQLDAGPDPDLPDDEEDEDAYELYEGPVHGGPWDGRHAQSRFPGGFLLVDMPARQVWIYDRGADGTFHVRQEAPMDLDEAKRWKTADEESYDLLVPDAEMEPS